MLLRRHARLPVPFCTLRVDASLALLEGNLGRPADGFPRNGDFLVQFVDLFQGQAFGLVDHEVDERDAEETASEPDEEDLCLEIGVAGTVVDEVGG